MKENRDNLQKILRKIDEVKNPAERTVYRLLLASDPMLFNNSGW